ncbi:MAG: SWIM zinc finger family protein, partial [Rhabdochlamydiaceae bacterium]
MPTATELRQSRGKAILTMENAVRRVTENEYLVKSQSGNGEYSVENISSRWICTCPDFVYRGFTCKHIFAAQYSQNIREEVKQNLVIAPIT